jgi:hypothetical protein
MIVNVGGLVVGNGTTTVGGGSGSALFTANGTVSGMVVVNNNGTLKGSGAVGAVEVNNGGNLSVGNSVGQLTVNGSNVPGGPSVTIDGGANILFEFNNATGTAGNAIPGQGGWDYVDATATGLLDITGATAGNKINLDIDSWLVDNSGPGAASNFIGKYPANPTVYDWLFIRAGTANTDAGTLNSGSGMVDLSQYFNIDDSGVFGPSGYFNRPNDRVGNNTLFPATFQVQWNTIGGTTGLYIHFQAVPEPSSMILAGLASLGAGWYGRRRKRREAAQAEAAAGNDGTPNA